MNTKLSSKFSVKSLVRDWITPLYSSGDKVTKIPTSPDAVEVVLSEKNVKKLVDSTPSKRQATVKLVPPSPKAPEHRTKGLVLKLLLASSPTSKLLRSTELCNHLLQFPEARGTAVKCGAVQYLLKTNKKCHDQGILAKTSECLSLLGYVPPLRSDGVRILSIDGGGTRAVMALEVLEYLECQLNGKKLIESFDYVVGVSTGAIIASLIFACKLSLADCKEIYRNVSLKLFDQSRVWGATGLVLSHSYYDTAAWVDYLKSFIGETDLVETVNSLKSPKIGIISAVVNQPKLESFVFRNYNLPSAMHSIYPGSARYKVWQAVQASAAAPGYFKEVKLDSYVHQDGGVLLNNPTSVALHESRLLWPNASIQCVVSVGCGRSAPIPTNPTVSVEYSSLKEKILKIIDSATETEKVHTLVNDLLPPSVYYRLNPYVTHPYTLDENDPKRLDQMVEDAQMYIRKNKNKLDRAAEQLNKRKRLVQTAVDWFRQ